MAASAVLVDVLATPRALPAVIGVHRAANDALARFSDLVVGSSRLRRLVAMQGGPLLAEELAWMQTRSCRATGRLQIRPC
jgi:hypothetical protein